MSNFEFFSRRNNQCPIVPPLKFSQCYLQLKMNLLVMKGPKSCPESRVQICVLSESNPVFSMLNLLCCMQGETKSLMAKLRYFECNWNDNLCIADPYHWQCAFLVSLSKSSPTFRGEGALCSTPPSSETTHARLHTSSLPPALRLIADFPPRQKSCHEKKERVKKVK